VATNQAKQSEPRTTTHKKDFLFYSEPISDIPNFAQKEIFSFHDKSTLHDWPQASSSKKPHHG